MLVKTFHVYIDPLFGVMFPDSSFVPLREIYVVCPSMNYYMFLG